jgi:hypothetical protein
MGGRSTLARILSPDLSGSYMSDSNELAAMIPGLTDKALFQPRALRVRLALYRWRLAHSGPWPATLMR